MADQGQGEGEPHSNPIRAIRQVPAYLLDFLRSRIVHYVERAEDIRAEIHEFSGQPARLVLYGAKFGVYEQTGEASDSVQDNVTKTNKILVKNIPSVIDEEILEVFFESKKKGGGGPVKNIQLNREKNWAIVEFSEVNAVELVMSKVPVKIMATELDIRPYTPLLQGDGLIESLDIRNLPKDLTEDLLSMHVEAAFGQTESSSAEYKSDEEDSQNEALPMMSQLTNTETCSKGERVIKQAITWLKPVQIKMLHITKYVEKVSEQFPDIKVELGLEKNEISFEGEPDMVHSVTLNLFETLSGFGLSVIAGKSEEYIELYKRERVIEHVNNKLKAQNIACALEVKGQMLVICSLEEDIAKCTTIVEESVTETKFPISRESSATFLTLEWQEEVKKIQDENEIQYKVSSDKNFTAVSVIATDNVIKGIVCSIEKFLKSQLTIKSETFLNVETISAKFRKLYDLDVIAWLKLLDRIAKDLSVHHVAIQREFLKGSSLTVTGTREGRELAKTRMANLDI